MRKNNAIETEYRGYKFRSRLEARWAVFFDACGVEWEYEPEGFILPSGQWYLPDFRLHVCSLDCRTNCDELYVEVKGKMTETDARKIREFYSEETYDSDGYQVRLARSILVLGDIPKGDTIDEITWRCTESADKGFPNAPNAPHPFNFETINGDSYPAHPCIDKNGNFALLGDDSQYLEDRNDAATLEAYKRARQARFEHGEKPISRRIIL